MVTINVYDKGQVDTKLANKANVSDVYTKTQTDNLLADKMDEVDTTGASEGDVLTLDSSLNPVWQSGGGGTEISDEDALAIAHARFSGYWLGARGAFYIPDSGSSQDYLPNSSGSVRNITVCGKTVRLETSSYGSSGNFTKFIVRASCGSATTAFRLTLFDSI